MRMTSYMGPALALGLALAWALPALAEDGVNPECLGSQCGRPRTEGGGCGCGCGCSVWVAYTDDGVQLSYTDDTDGDGIADDRDNCPFVSNRDQRDTDGDGVGDACDNCPTVANRDQHDINANGIGDACDSDMDGDGVPNERDNCPRIPNPDQKISFPATANGKGDACNDDIDGDGIKNANDNCPLWPNPDQRLPPEGSGIVCDTDKDGDGVGDSHDNCPTVYNPDQKDTDNNGIGDACDADIDGDGVLNAVDNCPTVYNPRQEDTANAGYGDACNANPGCFHTLRGNADCLDPRSPFKVSAGIQLDLDKTGIKVDLPLYANRQGANINAKYSITKSPAGSNAAIQHSDAYATRSARYAYMFDGDKPTFTPDKAGQYVIQVTGNLAFPDRAYPEVTSSTSTLTLNVGQGGKAGGCTAIPLGAPAIGVAVALLALLRRRRK